MAEADPFKAKGVSGVGRKLNPAESHVLFIVEVVDETLHPCIVRIARIIEIPLQQE